MNEPLSGVIVALDGGELDDLIPTIEILIQEGLSTLAIHCDTEDLGTLFSIYQRRARLGVHRVSVPDQVVAATASGATFVLPDLWNAELAAACVDVAVYPPAMTPTEIRGVLAQEVTGVQVVPGDLLGPSFAELLAAYGLADRCLPRHSLGAYAMGKWFEAGAKAVVADTQLLGDALTGGDLGALRDRCGSFAKVQAKAASN